MKYFMTLDFQITKSYTDRVHIGDMLDNMTYLYSYV